MTNDERVQVEKDVLYEEYETAKELAAHLFKIERAEEQMRNLLDSLSVFRGSLIPSNPITAEEGNRYRQFINVDLQDVSKSCAAARELSDKLKRIRERRSSLGL